jgi:hypothetical protein
MSKNRLTSVTLAEAKGDLLLAQSPLLVVALGLPLELAHCMFGKRHYRDLQM